MFIQISFTPLPLFFSLSVKFFQVITLSFFKNEKNMLDGLYCTVHGEEHKLHSWQNIAIQKPFKIDLKQRR